MVSIKESAVAYEPKTTKNITELEKVSVNIEMEERKFSKEDGTEFSINVIIVNDEEYRVPTQVIQQLKGLMDKFPETEFFTVSKTGEGLKTQYQVFPSN